LNGKSVFSNSGGLDQHTKLTTNQNRLIFLVDLYTKQAVTRDELDTWIRKTALSVIIYEGIVAGVFDYDYAPQSILIKSRRIWINISQEALSDIEFLREEEILHALQMPSSSYKPITCYQISEKGKEFVQNVPREDKEAVIKVVYMSGSQDLLKPMWDENSYWLSSSLGVSKKSTITEIEDVSYVSSAYIPQCLRYGGRPTLSNAHRTHECLAALSNIRDKNIDEIITLSSVSLIVAEFIPFGANHIVQANNNIGATERVQGGFISPAIDEYSSETSVEMSSQMTSVEILDFTLTNHVNLEAEIRFPEEKSIVQVETFGISLNAEGTCFYGMQIEAVMDRIKDNISLDYLSRILVDVQQDSSTIVDSILSQYQRDLMNLVFIGDANNRSKVNLVIANEITPHLTAAEYMDKGDYENEFRQIIGDTKAAYDISENDTLVFGANGMLVCGPHARLHEPLLCAYLQFITLDTFLQNFFSRIWILNDDLAGTSTLIDRATSHPTALDHARTNICKLSKEIIQLDEITGYLVEALEIMEIPPEPPEQTGRCLYNRLEIRGMRNQLGRRINDVKKNLVGAQRFLDVLRERANIVFDAKMAQLSETLDQNTKRISYLQESNSEIVHILQLMQFLLAGILAFATLDRITGDWTVLNTKWMESFVNTMLKNNVLLWFVVSMLTWFVTALSVQGCFTFLKWKSQGMTKVRIQINRRICLDKIGALLQNKIKILEERRVVEGKDIVQIEYKDTDARGWGGSAPSVTLEYDETNRYLLEVGVNYNIRKARKHLAFNAIELKEKILGDLKGIGIYDRGHESSSQQLAMEKRDTIAVALKSQMLEAKKHIPEASKSSYLAVPIFPLAEAV